MVLWIDKGTFLSVNNKEMNETAKRGGDTDPRSSTRATEGMITNKTPKLPFYAHKDRWIR